MNDIPLDSVTFVGHSLVEGVEVTVFFKIPVSLYDGRIVCNLIENSCDVTNHLDRNFQPRVTGVFDAVECESCIVHLAGTT